MPTDPRLRAELLGWLELVAGEEGIGWNARLAMIRASHESNGECGFPLAVATYLEQRYGFDAGVDLRSRVGEQLTLVHERLRGGPYFDGGRLSALDIYAATFLTPLSVIDEASVSADERRAPSRVRERTRALRRPSCPTNCGHIAR